MIQIKSDRSEAVKKYTKCSFTDHTDIALDQVQFLFLDIKQPVQISQLWFQC